MLTMQDERQIVDRLALKYLDKCVKNGEIYTSYDLFYDILCDEEYENLIEKGYIDISNEDLMVMCKEEYDNFFFKPLRWGF